MKVGNPVDKALPAAPATGPGAAADATKNAPAGTAAARHAAPDASAKVELSSAASSLLSSGSTPEFDADKVARISQAIADGSFKVDPQAIADKLIANAQELLSKTHG